MANIKKVLVIYFAFIFVFFTTFLNCMSEKDLQSKGMKFYNESCAFFEEIKNEKLGIIGLNQIIADYFGDIYQLAWEITNNNDILCLSFSPNGNYLAIGGIGEVKKFGTMLSWLRLKNPEEIYDNTLKIWDLNSKDITVLGSNKRGHTGAVGALAYSPDNKYLASGSNDRTIKIWDGNSNECLRTFDLENGLIKSLEFTIDSVYLVSLDSNGCIKIIDIDVDRCCFIFDNQNGGLVEVSVIKIHPNDRYIISGSLNGDFNVLDIKSHQSISKEVLGNKILGLECCQHGQFLFSMDINALKVWDINALSTGNFQANNIIHFDSLKNLTLNNKIVKLSPDNKYLISTDQYIIRIYSMKDLKLINAIVLNYSDIINSLAFSPKGKYLALAIKNKIKIWFDIRKYFDIINRLIPLNDQDLEKNLKEDYAKKMLLDEKIKKTKKEAIKCLTKLMSIAIRVSLLALFTSLNNGQLIYIP